MKKIILLLLILVISSCYKEVKIDIPEQDILPVVNSIFQTDSVISLDIRKTQTILENKPTKITDAVVTLFEDGQVREVLEFQGELFTSNTIAKVNAEYTIEIEIPSFETVTAKEKLVDFPKVFSSSFSDSVYVGDEGDLFSQATIEIENTADNDYFELNMFLRILDAEQPEHEEDFFYGSTGSILYFDPILNDIVIQNEGLLSYAPSILVFSNELMPEGKYTLRVNYRPFNSNIYSDNPDADIVLVMKLRKVSKNYYEYKKTLIRHIETQFGDIWDGVGEPVPLFTNIENGYGIFAGYSEVTDTIYKER
jgi:hypothetical protein